MTIDEAIEQFKYDAECNRADLDLSYAEDNEQVAEWLKELKAYREIGTVEECKNSVLDILKVYNKAIDDFAKRLKTDYVNFDLYYILQDNNVAFEKTSLKSYQDMIDELAEQLKAGGK